MTHTRLTGDRPAALAKVPIVRLFELSCTSLDSVHYYGSSIAASGK